MDLEWPAHGERFVPSDLVKEVALDFDAELMAVVDLVPVQVLYMQPRIASVALTGLLSERDSPGRPSRTPSWPAGNRRSCLPGCSIRRRRE